MAVRAGTSEALPLDNYEGVPLSIFMLTKEWEVHFPRVRAAWFENPRLSRDYPRFSVNKEIGKLKPSLNKLYFASLLIQQERKRRLASVMESNFRGKIFKQSSARLGA